MYVDKKLEFSDGQAITATAISAAVVDLVGASQDIGTGEPTYLVVQVDEAFNNLTSLTITAESDSTAGLATSATTHFSSGAIALADLVAGAQVVAVALPAGDYERYLGMRYTVTGAAPTTGKVSAFLTKDYQSWKSYPDAL